MKKLAKVMSIILLVIFILTIGCYIGLCAYAADFRTLDADYEYVLDGDGVTVSSKLVHFAADSDTGLVFYQGGRVDFLAYAPLMQKFQQAGINCFLVDAPFNMAIFNIGVTADLIAEHSEISNWYVGGHSLGGVAADSFANSNADMVRGVVFLGIYSSTDYSLDNTITIYGSNDLRVGDSVTYDTNVHIIEGGNHAQFGNYGDNDGDGVATITTEEQQNITTELVAEFVASKNE